MEVGCDRSPSLTHHYMVDAGGIHLKRARSPPRPMQLLVTNGPPIHGTLLVSSGHSSLGLSYHLLRSSSSNVSCWWHLHQRLLKPCQWPVSSSCLPQSLQEACHRPVRVFLHRPWQVGVPQFIQLLGMAGVGWEMLVKGQCWSCHHLWLVLSDHWTG